MGWHLCSDYDSCFQAIWQPCMEVHMTAGESPVAKWRQYRISITLAWSLGYPGTQVLSWGSSSTFFLYAFFLKVIFITSHQYSYCQTTSSLSLAPMWVLMIPSMSIWTNVLNSSKWSGRGELQSMVVGRRGVQTYVEKKRKADMLKWNLCKRSYSTHEDRRVSRWSTGMCRLLWEPSRHINHRTDPTRRNTR